MKRNSFVIKDTFLLIPLCFFLVLSSCRYTSEPKSQDQKRENSIHKEMKFIPSANKECIIGKEEEYSNVSTPHPVLFTYNFWMDSTEVTQGEYDSLMRHFYSEYSMPAWDTVNGKGDNYPAYLVNWYDAVLYCNARSKLRGLDTIYSYHKIIKDNKGKTILPSLKINLNKNGYRLPTEAEWEFAYRAGSTADFYWGDTIPAMGNSLSEEDSLKLNNYIVYRANSRSMGKESPVYGVQPVASKLPNNYGLYDMGGNVEEWPHNFSYRYTSEKEVNPVGPEFGRYRALRGGSWSSFYNHCSAANKVNTGSDVSNVYTGFRVVAAELPPKQSTATIDDFIKRDKKIRGKDGLVPLDMVKISAKDHSFQMGGSGGVFNQRPIQEVRFTYDFLIGRTEVTRKEYDELMSKSYEKYETPQWDSMGNKASVHPKTTVNWIDQKEVSGKFGLGASRPATYINWYDAALYCNALSLDDGYEPVYEYSSIVGTPGNGSLLTNLKCNMQKSGYRLPTEAEWEFAFRGGQSSEHFWGVELDENILKKFAQYERNAKILEWTEPHNEKSGSQAVGQLLPNGFGLYDMSGNVWEWCTDLHYYYYGSQVTDPVQLEKGNKRIVRGGSWYNDSSYISGVHRSYPGPESRNNGRGFRVSRSVTVPESWKE